MRRRVLSRFGCLRGARQVKLCKALGNFGYGQFVSVWPFAHAEQKLPDNYYVIRQLFAWHALVQTISRKTVDSRWQVKTD